MNNNLKLDFHEKQIIKASKSWFQDYHEGEIIDAIHIIVTEMTNYYDPTFSGVYYFVNEIMKKIKINYVEFGEKIHKDIEMTQYYNNFNNNDKKYGTLAYLKTLISFIAGRRVTDFYDELGEPDYEYFNKAKDKYLELKRRYIEIDKIY